MNMAEKKPFKEGMLTTPLSPLEDVRLRGVRCRACGSYALGKREHCINCTSQDLEEHVFSKQGVVFTFTIIRHPPPLPYPQETFKPFPAAWVKLEEGLYIVSELTDCGLDEVEIGMPVELVVGKGWADAEGNDVIMYKFRKVK
jgi:uncharacterized OB-fold protein